MPKHTLVERAKTVPIAPLLAKLPHLLLFGGGVVIKIHDEVIGAIGAADAPPSYRPTMDGRDETESHGGF